MKQQFKDYKAMTADEQMQYIAELTEFDQQHLPRLQKLQQERKPWTSDDRKAMAKGLQLIGAFAFAQDFAAKGLYYGDYAARVDRMRFYMHKVKQEVARGVTVSTADGKQYAYVPGMQQQFRRRGRPTLQEQAQQRQFIANAENADAETRRQTAIARLLGIEVVVGQQLRERNNDEIAAEREQRKREDAKRNPGLFEQDAGQYGGAAASHRVGKTTEQQPGSTERQADVAAMLPDIDLSAVATEYRLTLNQKAPFLSEDLRPQVAEVRVLRTAFGDASNTAKLLAEQGKSKDDIAPYASRAAETLERIQGIYAAIDTELATVCYRLQNDGDFREKWLKRYRFRSMDDVSKDLLYDLRKHLSKVDSPEFQLRMKTLIEQESPEYVASMKAEAEKKEEIQGLLRYIRRTDKDLTAKRLEGLRERWKRLNEIDPEEAKVQWPIIQKAEEDFAQMQGEVEAKPEKKAKKKTKTANN